MKKGKKTTGGPKKFTSIPIQNSNADEPCGGGA